MPDRPPLPPDAWRSPAAPIGTLTGAYWRFVFTAASDFDQVTSPFTVCYEEAVDNQPESTDRVIRQMPAAREIAPINRAANITLGAMPPSEEARA